MDFTPRNNGCIALWQHLPHHPIYLTFGMSSCMSQQWSHKGERQDSHADSNSVEAGRPTAVEGCLDAVWEEHALRDRGTRLRCETAEDAAAEKAW